MGAGLAKPSSSSRATAATPQKSSTKPTNRYANYSSPASLGYQDPDAEKLAAAAELRRTQGVAGQWELVEATPQPAEVEASGSTSPVPDPGPLLKREADTMTEDEDGRRFKLQKRTLEGGLGEIYDPGVIPIKLKKKDEPVDTAAASAPTIQPNEQSKLAPKWTKVKWDTPLGDGVKQEPEPADGKVSADDLHEGGTKSTIPPEGIPFKTEDQGILPQAVGISATHPIPESANMFRKRKIPSGAARGKRPT